LAEKLLAFDNGSCGEGADVANAAVAECFSSHIEDCCSVGAVFEAERLYDSLGGVPCNI
jgi:hypothetical protein